jgi:hypothetical protein
VPDWKVSARQLRLTAAPSTERATENVLFCPEKWSVESRHSTPRLVSAEGAM